ncbi:endoglucanase 2 [Xylariaceae sp. FL0255]|nr:endoglucanase 2 [Xylariaceae sp. FL0255]
MHFSFFSSLALASVVTAKVQYLGVAIAGGDFGCQIDGTCPTGSTQLPLSVGPTQINHFVKDDGMNLMRIPISWQFLVNNQLGADLDSSNLSQYDQLVQACLETGAYCMVDIHNFARWNGQIIGQGGPTNEQFANLWSQLATKYASDGKVVFELMNEPHDLDIPTWAQTLQQAVTAIRQAGATSQMILLSGTNFDSAATLVSSGSADALLNITNPDGSTDNLILDIHKYLDEDNSGTHTTCTTDNVDVFTAIAQYLRGKGRQGLISETGASSDSTCLTAFCSQNSFINANSDVFAGLVVWAAGSFSTSYTLSLTPSTQNGQLVDNTLMKQCVLATWNHSSNSTIPSTSLTFSSASTTTVVSTTAGASTTTAPTSGVTKPASTSAAVTTATNLNHYDTSGYLTLTTSIPISDFTSLDIATGTPTVPTGFNGLLSSASSTLSSTTSGISSAGAMGSTSATPSTTAVGAASSITRSSWWWGVCGAIALVLR